MFKKSILAASIIFGALSLTACSDELATKTVDAHNQKTESSQTAQVAQVAQVAQTPKVEYKEGIQYRVLEKPLEYVNNQVTEFFWYGCPHCYDANPFAHEWADSSNGKYTLVQKHTQLSERWLFDANVYFGLKEVDRMDISQNYFDGRQQGQFKDINDVSAWLQNNGVNPVQFFENLKNPELIKQREDLLAQERSLEAGGVPAFVVEGKYLVLVRGVSDIGGWKGLPGLLTYLADLDGK